MSLDFIFNHILGSQNTTTMQYSSMAEGF